jgi:hypothetical protein
LQFLLSEAEKSRNSSRGGGGAGKYRDSSDTEKVPAGRGSKDEECPFHSFELPGLLTELSTLLLSGAAPVLEKEDGGFSETGARVGFDGRGSLFSE